MVSSMKAFIFWIHNLHHTTQVWIDMHASRFPSLAHTKSSPPRDMGDRVNRQDSGHFCTVYELAMCKTPSYVRPKST